MQTITVEWDGEAHEFAPSHDLYMRIEDKVAFNRLATLFERAALSDEGKLELPMSQVSWVMYCVLRHCGVPIKNPMEVHQALFSSTRLPNYGQVLGDLIGGYYNAMPERPVKKKPAAKPKKKASPR